MALGGHSFGKLRFAGADPPQSVGFDQHFPFVTKEIELQLGIRCQDSFPGFLTEVVEGEIVAGAIAAPPISRISGLDNNPST